MPRPRGFYSQEDGASRADWFWGCKGIVVQLSSSAAKAQYEAFSFLFILACRGFTASSFCWFEGYTDSRVQKYSSTSEQR